MTDNTAQNGTKDITPEQETYLEWLCKPVPLRTPKTKVEYSEQTGIPRRTMYNWEGNAVFDGERIKRIKQYHKNYTPQVLQAVYDKAVSGDMTAAKLFLEFVEGTDNKLKIEHSGENIKIVFYDADKDRKTEKVPAETTGSS